MTNVSVEASVLSKEALQPEPRGKGAAAIIGQRRGRFIADISGSGAAQGAAGEAES